VYAHHSEAGIFIPVDIVKFQEIGQNFNGPILIEGIEYYQNCRLLHTIEGSKIILGNSFSFLFFKENHKITFNFKIQGTLSQRINDTKFALALFKNKYYTMGGEKPHNFNCR
jgi:hypothetical protein